MVKLNAVRASNAALVASQPIVAVFVGVAGIAGFAALSLATTHGNKGKGLRAYIVGRKLEKVQPLISSCQKACPAGQFLFVQAKDLALLKDVDAVCAEIIRMEEKEAKSAGVSPKIDILVMAQAIFEAFSGKRKETTEGLDTFMSLICYSRLRFTTQLLPLLLSSPLPAHIISVFGPQNDRKFIESDLSLRDPANYGFMAAGSHAAYLKTFFMEYLAAKYPGKLALAHLFPGLVITDAFQDPSLPVLFRGVFKYGSWLVKPLTVGKEECGKRVIFGATARFAARGTAGGKETGKTDEVVAVSTDGIVGGGAYKVDWNGEVMATKKQYVKLREEGWEQKAVNHILKAFEEIEAKGVFTG